MSDESITMRRVGPDETERICELLSRVFPNNPKADPAVLRWQYWNCPFGETLSSVQICGGEIVGHVARVPLPILVDGRRTPGGITVDAATDPRFRNRGLYGSLRIWSNEQSASEGAEVGIDFRASRTRLPSGAAPRAALLTRYVIPLRAQWVSDRLRLPGVVARRLVRWARPRSSAGGTTDDVPDGVQELWAEIAPDIAFGVEKNETWWRWRYGAHPDRPYTFYALRSGGKLLAAAAATYRPKQDFLAVLDLLARDADSSAQLVGAIARSTDAGALAFITAKRTPWERIARAGGFRAIPFDRESQSLYVRDLVARRPNLAEQPWVATWGDMDHV